MPQKSLSNAALERMHEVCQGVAQKMGLQLLELNGEADHVHLLVEYQPPLSVLTLVKYLKVVSSRMLRKEFSELAVRGAHLWTPSYFAASAGGALIERLRGYVETQEKLS
jgi:putative transposase